MVKYCKKCHYENNDDAFWCSNCNSKLDVSSSIEDIPYRQSFDYPSINNYRNRAVKIFAIISVVCIILVAFFVFYGLSGQFSFNNINCKINEDFWFDGNYLNTSDGWSFTITKVKDYVLEGRIIALKTYDRFTIPYAPINVFSPIDIAIGTEDIMENPGKYDYSITSFNNRVYSWYLKYDDVSEYNYFKGHTGNNHIIPHNPAVLDVLCNISKNDCIVITGNLVNLHGTRGSQNYHWNTDTQIGNYACEIILVDSIDIL